MPFQIDSETKAFYAPRLKSEGFNDRQIETIFQMASGLVTAALLGFVNFVKIDPAEVDQLKLPGGTPQQIEDFRKGAKHLIKQQNSILEDTLQKLGINRVTDTRA